ncbi:MAG: carotenoid oxygenase family protein [Pseudomonadota bacterium]
MKRRTFLTQAAGAALAGAAWPVLGGEWRDAFASAAADKPWLLGYQSVDREAYAADVAIEGRWPAGLRGTFFRNGPAQHEVGGYRYRHWFDGDGLVQCYQPRGDRLQHRAQLVETAKRQQEKTLGRAALPTFGSLPPEAVGVPHADALNPANISLLWHHERLFALWEAGSPHEIAPEDLSTRGVHAFSDSSARLPFSAHPRVEPDGTLWNFGYATTSGTLVLWHLSPDGQVVKLKALPVRTTGMPHDFVVTERYIVLLLAPLHRDPEATPEQGFLGMKRWYPERPTRVLVVDKNNFELVKEFELPAQWVFHFGNGFDDGRDVIRFDAARHDNPDVMLRTFRSVMRGEWTPVRDARWYEYTLNLNTGKATESRTLNDGVGVEFPKISPQESTRRHRRVVLLSSGQRNRDLNRPGDLREVSCWHREADRLASYAYPSHYLVEEHQLVTDAQADAGRGGWILGTALNLKEQATEINVFRADHLADGPVARARLPYALPLGLHGVYVPEASA